MAVIESDPLRAVGYGSILGESSDWEPRPGLAADLLRVPELRVWLVGNVEGSPVLEQVTVWRRLRPELRILVAGPGREDVDVLRALSAGAKGFLNEAAGKDELLLALSVVAQGSVWAPRRVLSQLIETVIQRPATSGRSQGEPGITPREREVLEHLVEGRSNKEIAHILHIEERTVKAHVAKLLRKVGAPNRIALTMHAIHHAMLEKSVGE